MGGGRRRFPEGAVRINFLEQARHEVLRGVGGPLGRLLAASLGQHMLSIGKKSQIRLGNEIKHKLCKVMSVWDITLLNFDYYRAAEDCWSLGFHHMCSYPRTRRIVP